MTGPDRTLDPKVVTMLKVSSMASKKVRTYALQIIRRVDGSYLRDNQVEDA